MKIILSQQKVDKALDTNRGKDEQIKLSAEAEKAQQDLANNDDKKKINNLLK